MNPLFRKLFEMLPEADTLLSLEPEDLAGPLLISLDGSQTITPEGIISHDSMKYAIQGDLERTYPYKCRNEVLFALMEAWQWLEREGFVAPRPTGLVGSTTVTYTTRHFVTRRLSQVEPFAQSTTSSYNRTKSMVDILTR